MNTIRRIKKNTKALSPVVASIILIAVTVAVSIAVAAWMGALSVGFMQTEQLSITNCVFDKTAGNIRLSVRNTGTSNINITQATVNGAEITLTNQYCDSNTQGYITVPYSTSNIVSGNSYQIRLLSVKGTWFPYNAVAP